MRRLLLIGCAALLAVAVWAAWFVRDANRFRPALASAIERTTGIPVEIRGGLGWRFGPSPRLVAETLGATHEGRTWSLERLVLRPDIVSLVRHPGALGNWRIDGFNVRNLVVEDARGLLRVPRLTLRNIEFDRPAPLEARLVYTRDGLSPIDVSLTGALTLAADRVGVRELALRAPNASGVCNAEATPNGKLWPAASKHQNAILPVAIMRDYDWDGRCDFEQIVYAGATIKNAYVVLDNKEGGSIVTAHAPTFLGGEAHLDMVIRADQAPVTWGLNAMLSGVNSDRLANLLGGNSLISAAVDYEAVVRMTGNTPQALLASINAQSHFSSESGELDIAWMAKPLSAIPGLIDRSNGRPAFPNRLDYKRLAGSWSINGEAHRADLTLDNLELKVAGDYWLKEDRMDAQAELKFGDNEEYASLAVSPLLVGVPLHFRCQGTRSDPACKLDTAQTVISGLSTVLTDRVIPEHIPEKYQDMALSLLEALNKTLSGDADQPLDEKD